MYEVVRLVTLTPIVRFDFLPTSEPTVVEVAITIEGRSIASVPCRMTAESAAEKVLFPSFNSLRGRDKMIMRALDVWHERNKHREQQADYYGRSNYAWKKAFELLDPLRAETAIVVQGLINAMYERGFPDPDSLITLTDKTYCESRYFLLHRKLWFSSSIFETDEVYRRWIEVAENPPVFQYAASSRRITEKVRREVWRRDGGSCRKCGSRTRLEFDHIVPVAKGGSNTARNVELLCEVCNRAKSDSVG